MKKYEELTNDDQDTIMNLVYEMYDECSSFTLSKNEYEQMIKYFNELKEFING